MQTKIDKLISELNECREDERNTQNQILQVMSVAGTILSILLGTSYFNLDLKGKAVIVFANAGDPDASWADWLCAAINRNITYARVTFWLSL